MAITGLFVNTAPGGYPSINDSLFVMATSDLTSSINFRYVVDVFDANGNQLVRSRVYPDIYTGACYFDVASILRNEMRFDWFYKMNSDLGVVYCRELDNEFGEAGVKFTIAVGEEYYSGIDLVSDLQQSTFLETAWNWVPPIFGRMLPGSGIENFLGFVASNRPKRLKYIKGTIDPLFCGFFSTNDAATMRVRVYNSAGTEINSDVITLSFSIFTLQQLNISPKAINASAGNTVVDVNAAAFYTLEFDNNNAITNLRVDLHCPREGVQPIYLHFMNSVGVFETAIFDLVNKTFSSTARKGFVKKEVQLGTNADPFSIKFYEGENGANPTQFERRLNFDTATNYTMRLAMDYPTDEEFEWLAELISTPQVFMSSKTGAGNNGSAFYPITIKANDYEYFQRKYSKLKTFELEIELNQPRNFYRR